MFRHFCLLILISISSFVYSAQSTQQRLYTLLEGEQLDTGFQYYFHDTQGVQPCIKINDGSDIYIIYQGTKYGPYKRVSKRLFDKNGLLILMELIDHRGKGYILSFDNRIFGPHNYIIDWKYNPLNHFWMAQLTHGSSTILINGTEYGPFDEAWDISMNSLGTRWSFLVQQENTQFYVTDQWNQYYQHVKTDLNLYKPENTRYFKHYRDPTWKHWVVVFQTEKGYFIENDNRQIFGPYDQVGEVFFYESMSWIVPLHHQGKYSILDTGLEKPLAQKILDQDAVYALPGNVTTPYLVITEKWNRQKIVSDNKSYGPFKVIGEELPARIQIHHTNWATSVQQKQTTRLLINGRVRGEFDSVIDIMWDNSDDNWLAVVSPPDDYWYYLYFKTGIHMTAMKQLVDIRFISLEKYIFGYIGRDEKYYVESSDGRRWGPFQKVYKVFLQQDKPVFSVLEKGVFKIYRDGYQVQGSSYALQQEVEASVLSGDIHWISIQGKNISYQ